MHCLRPKQESQKRKEGGLLGKLKGPLREQARAQEKILIKLPIHGSPFPSAHCGYCLDGGCIFFRMSVSSPPWSSALMLFYHMERFHREPLPFSQAGLGQYQCCASELGRRQKLALELGILLLLCCGQALPSNSSLARGAEDRCHLAKPLP